MVTRLAAAVLLAAAAVAVASPSLAQAAEPGSLDRSFSGDGEKLIDFGRRELAERAFVDASGRVTLAGVSGDSPNRLAMARVLSGGALDDSFSSDGRRVVDPASGADEAATWALSGGELYVYGFRADGDFYLMRFRADGRTDRQFGNDGTVVGSFRGDGPTFSDIVVLPSGRIVILGGGVNGQTQIKAFNADGTRARAFGDRGTATIDGVSSALVYQAGNRILVVGARNDRRLVVDALRSNGTMDPSFGSGGRASVAIGTSAGDDVASPTVSVMSNGDIAIATDVFDEDSFTTDLVVARFTSNGSRDAGFGGGDGWTRMDLANIEVALSIAPLSGGRMIISGFASDDFFDLDAQSDLLLVGLRANGQRWTAFGAGGVVRTDLGLAGDVSASDAVVHNGKLVVAGQAARDMLVARFRI